MILDGPELIESMKKLVGEKHSNVEAALFVTFENFAQILEALEDVYLSARVMNVWDVTTLILKI